MSYYFWACLGLDFWQILGLSVASAIVMLIVLGIAHLVS